MPTSYTPNLDLNLPEIGAARDTWGALLNANFTSLDQFVSQSAPIGIILDFAGPAAPSGWLIADGRLVSRTTYSALFAVLGTAWGAGDGTTTFGLPNLNGRTAVGPGTITDANGNSMTLSFATTIGALSYQILQTHLPNYAMTSNVAGLHSHGGASQPGGSHNHTTDAQGNHSHGGATAAGGDHGHGGTTDWQGNHSHNVYGGLFGGGSGNGMAFQANAQQGQYLGYTDTQGNHYHNLSVSNSGNVIQLGISADGVHAHTTTTVGNHQHSITADGNHSHTIFLGGSSAWFPVMQPAVVVTKIIYAGQQAAVVVMTDTAPMRVIEGESDELLQIREELAQLRAMVALVRGPAQQRRLSTPLRGSH